MEFLPTSIIPRLMVKLHTYIHNNQIWKTGMVLKEGLLFNSIANIVLDSESKKIYIDIQGERNRDFLTVIRKVIEEINDSYQEIEVTEWIPLPDLYKGEQLLVDYQELLGYEQAGQEQFFSGKLKQAFPVTDLLNGIEKPEMRTDSPLCNIFVSYAEEDLLYKEKLMAHLMPFKRLNQATIWDKSSIDAGTEWEKEMADNLNRADMVLCLISSSFIASTFCYEKELSLALAAHNEKSKVVIPIKIKEVNWDNLEIAQIEGLPRTKWMEDIADEKSWTEISRGIEVAIQNIKRRK